MTDRLAASLQLYDAIEKLRSMTDAQARGYEFEKVLRDGFPWDRRQTYSHAAKAVTTIGGTDQIDAFFEWNSWHFMVEAKAKKSRITKGSADWSDFEIKVRDRPGQCISLFCSLSEVNADVIASATSLMQRGGVVIIIAGATWSALRDARVPLDGYLRYMVFDAKSRHSPVPTSIDAVRAWIYDRERAESILEGECDRYSATFLRREKSDLHHALYVSRAIDERISVFADALDPTRLTNLERRVKHGETELSNKRAPPQQICVVRDLSGAGKTTLAVQLCSERHRYFGAGCAALQPSLDDSFKRLWDGFGDGLASLIASGRPLVCVVDSLDEASAIPNKYREVNGLLRLLNEANKVAVAQGLLCAPIGIVFTVREDFWRAWAPYFEGVSILSFSNQFSTFIGREVDEALERYCSAYRFRIQGLLDAKTREVLSHPFTLQVFAEANKHQGLVRAEQVLDEQVLALHFQRKKEQILNRPIAGFGPESMMPILSDLAVRMVSSGIAKAEHTQVLQCIATVFEGLRAVADQILRALVSEQVLLRDPEEVGKYRFRHIRFAEYLVAWSAAGQLSRSQTHDDVERVFGFFNDLKNVSLFQLHQFLRFIARNEFIELNERLEGYFAQSLAYAKPMVVQMRAYISGGKTPKPEDLLAIRKAAASSLDAGVIWEAFFVVAARFSGGTSDQVLELFVLAWKGNLDREDRFKLLPKLQRWGLLFHEHVLGALLVSERAKEWLVFLKEVELAKAHDAFREFSTNAASSRLRALVDQFATPDWRLAERWANDLAATKKLMPDKRISIDGTAVSISAGNTAQDPGSEKPR